MNAKYSGRSVIISVIYADTLLYDVAEFLFSMINYEAATL